MEDGNILSLFDFYWFDRQILTEKLPFPSQADPVLSKAETGGDEQQLSALRHLHRSFSDQLNTKSDSFSPSSVLEGRKLQTILSGKESNSWRKNGDEGIAKRTIRKSSRQERSSKSLSDLEFQELKGFMDLGFTFSEEDINSRLISILPGLQRLGKKEEDAEADVNASSISRPYLSEAWGVSRKDYKPETDCRITLTEDKSAMKDRIKFWAHAVASTLR